MMSHPPYVVPPRRHVVQRAMPSRWDFTGGLTSPRKKTIAGGTLQVVSPDIDCPENHGPALTSSETLCVEGPQSKSRISRALRTTCRSSIDQTSLSFSSPSRACFHACFPAAAPVAKICSSRYLHVGWPRKTKLCLDFNPVTPCTCDRSGDAGFGDCDYFGVDGPREGCFCMCRESDDATSGCGSGEYFNCIDPDSECGKHRLSLCCCVV